ncbi:MAG: hypothetical protein AW08_03298 [Candidatus Accumulibacter adjunctus]|uniref:Uncharacterized protein n=1 Tax=Candidatus Accumulibacter adjunctus TaxID=1454001 RepID=A0A011M6X1_9PROT|nr:MAG: hypothetical protein AW08_03298 [Candidatus Accumulibacter adjunctus]
MVERIAGGELSQDRTLLAGDTQSMIAHQKRMQLRLRAVLNDFATAVASTQQAAQSLAASAQPVAHASHSRGDSAGQRVWATRWPSSALNQGLGPWQPPIRAAQCSLRQ